MMMELSITTAFIPFTLARRIGIWIAPRIVLPPWRSALQRTWQSWALSSRGKHKSRWIFVLALAAMLGALRHNLAQPHFAQTSLATYNDQQKAVIVKGIIVGEPDVRDQYTDLHVEADHLLIADQPTRPVRGLARPGAAVHRFPLWRPDSR